MTPATYAKQLAAKAATMKPRLQSARYLRRGASRVVILLGEPIKIEAK